MSRTARTLGAALCALGLGFSAMAEVTQPSLELARGLVDAERYEEAVSVLRRLDAEDAGAASGVGILMGRVYLAIGKPAKALGYFEDASFSSLDGEGEAYLGLAEAELALGDLGKARRNAALALRTDPDLVAAHLVIARADQRAGRAADAFARLRKLRGEREDSEDVAVVMARFLASTEGAGPAIVELEGFLKRVPEAAGARDALRRLLWSIGDRDGAIVAAKSAEASYRRRGQIGRAEALSSWLKAVSPAAPVKAGPGEATEPTGEPAGSAVREPPREPPSPRAQPRAPVESSPAPPPARKITRSAALDRPEPFPIEPGSPILTGSGVVMEGGRSIVTNRHVVEGISALYVRNGTGHVRKARVVKMSSDDDLALLEIDKPFPEGAVVPLSDVVQPVAGRAAIVMGYPMIGLLGDEQPALTEGIVAKAAGLANDPNTFQLTSKINKGNSGGPVFDKRGRLLGVAVGKTDSAKVYERTGALVEDMNIGIKGGRILVFLGKKPSPETEPPEMSLEDLYREMLPRSVLIVGQR
ncbi:trypsin-like serine protease [Paramagnetospirillum caucaseum]|uniref:Trypsin-like serine protease n=2 Tax=Paramagnetospirillum caucaseum TaxID=1244869 RepID=M3A4D0_9PROT|nr:trypsin-like serine protease [Paramagnetospirillum caucaseum]